LPDHELPDHELPDHELPDQELPDHELPLQESPDHEFPFQLPPVHELPYQVPADQLFPAASEAAIVPALKDWLLTSCSPVIWFPFTHTCVDPRVLSRDPEPVEGVKVCTAMGTGADITVSRRMATCPCLAP
jgi:hypothetical protein